MNRSVYAIVFLIVVAFVGTAFGEGMASAKFTATIDKVELVTPLLEGLQADVESTVAYIKVANQKDLLIGVSAQIAIDTDTKVKEKMAAAALPRLKARSKCGLPMMTAAALWKPNPATSFSLHACKN